MQELLVRIQYAVPVTQAILHNNYSSSRRLVLQKDLNRQKDDSIRQQAVQKYGASFSEEKQSYFQRNSSDSICKLSKYFGVTSDYLLCLSDNRNNSIGLSDAEKMLIETFRGCPETEKYKMMHYCMTLQEQKGLSEIAG